jgi:hypothetical protein
VRRVGRPIYLGKGRLFKKESVEKLFSLFGSFPKK